MSVSPYLLCCFMFQVLGFIIWVGAAIQHHPSPTSAGEFPLEGNSLHQTKGRQTEVIQIVVMLRGVRLWCEKINTQPWWTRVAREVMETLKENLLPRGAERFLLIIMNVQLRWEDLERSSGPTFHGKGTPYYLAAHPITSWKFQQWGLYPTLGDIGPVLMVIPTACVK